MNKLKVSFFLLIFSIMALLLLPPELRSEIYKYVDKNGTIHFVDDMTKVPEEYRGQVAVYEDKIEEPSDVEADEAQTRQLEQLQEEEEKAREALEKALVTKVTISGNKVLVPVTLAYLGREVQATLVLDTGADLITIHRPIADQLHLPLNEKAEVRVTGGKIIRARVAKLDYARVGPYEAQDIQVLIILHQGSPVSHDGLLGMNFLRSLEYSIDFENQVIKWKPSQ